MSDGYGALGTKPDQLQHIELKHDDITVAVFGAHLSDQPLNGILRAWGATFVSTCVTTPVYRMYLVPGALVPGALVPSGQRRPGLVRVTDGGVAIAGELWRLPAAGFGRLVESVTSPLAIGTVECAGIGSVKGFLCEAAVSQGTRDISAYGDWRGFLAGAVS